MYYIYYYYYVYNVYTQYMIQVIFKEIPIKIIFKH